MSSELLIEMSMKFESGTVESEEYLRGYWQFVDSAKQVFESD
jgi:hypothetical protein